MQMSHWAAASMKAQLLMTQRNEFTIAFACTNRAKLRHITHLDAYRNQIRATDSREEAKWERTSVIRGRINQALDPADCATRVLRPA
jgi:hypothetical protein